MNRTGYNINFCCKAKYCIQKQKTITSPLPTSFCCWNWLDSFPATSCTFGSASPLAKSSVASPFTGDPFCGLSEKDSTSVQNVLRACNRQAKQVQMKLQSNHLEILIKRLKMGLRLLKQQNFSSTCIYCLIQVNLSQHASSDSIIFPQVDKFSPAEPIQ